MKILLQNFPLPVLNLNYKTVSAMLSVINKSFGI